jgi:type II secretory pathway component GspD/PulD (secretin)
MVVSSSSLAGKIVRWAFSGALCLFFLSPNTPAHAQKTVLEVITLKYRTAEQVIPVLEPLIPKPGTISGLQHQLIIRTTPANLADIKQVLTTLDAVPRRLLITVRQDAALDSGRIGAEMSGSASSGVTQSGAVVQAGREDDFVRGRVDSTRSLDSDRNTQTLQVLEGNSAFIRTGQSVPLPQRQALRTIVNGRIVERVIDSVEYRDVMTGFYALSRLVGDRVTLEINPQRDTLPAPDQNLPPGSVNVQRIATTVSGRLGEWMEIGRLVQGVSNEQSVILGSTRETSTDNRRIMIKVDAIR